jgi:tRNA U55 pseudouridine synthase TruB
MSNDEFVRRINNQLSTIAENQALFDERQAQFDKRQAQFIERQALFDERQEKFDRNMAAMQEAIAGLIQVARLHNEQITALRQQGKDQQERLDALIRIIEGHLSDHP